MKFFKNRKGSQLVEKILMTAFAVAGGGAVIVYGVNVINNSKTTNITLDGTVVATNSHGVQLIAGNRYKFLDRPSFNNLQKTDMEWVSCSKIYNSDGTEKLTDWSSKNQNASYDGFIGYSCWHLDVENETMYLAEVDEVTPTLSFYFSEAGIAAITDGAAYYEYQNDKPRLNDTGYDDYWNLEWSFVFSGTYVRQGNGPHLIDYLTYYNEE